MTHTNVYVGLAVEGLPLAALRDEVCSRFGLIYFGARRESSSVAAWRREA